MISRPAFSSVSDFVAPILLKASPSLLDLELMQAGSISLFF